MIIFGKLSDSNMAEKITRDLQQRGVSAGYSPRDVDGYISLHVYQETDFEFAERLYKVAMRLPGATEENKHSEWRAIKSLKMGLLGQAIFALCVSIYGLTFFFDERIIFSLLSFSNVSEFETIPIAEVLRNFWTVILHYDGMSMEAFDHLRKMNLLAEMMNGEIWRSIGPCFFHFGFIHILFNLLWWRDLSSVVEKVRGQRFLLFFFIVVGVVSNFFQFIVTGPKFGGLSGVVFGLLGFLGASKILNPRFQYPIPKVDLYFIVGWFFLGLFRLSLFSMANIVHGTGLALGLAFAVFSGAHAASPQRVAAVLLASIFFLLGPFALEVYFLTH